MRRSLDLGFLAGLVLLGLASMTFAQSGLMGDTYNFSANNFPDSFGVTRFVTTGELEDHGTPPVELTFDGVAEMAGGMMVSERAAIWDGKPGGIPVVHEVGVDIDGQIVFEFDLAAWETPGEIVEFSFQTVDGDYINSEPDEHAGFAATGLEWNGADLDTDVEFYTEGGFFFYFSRDGVPASGYASTLPIGVAVGPHPFDESVPEVVYILYSEGEVDENTDLIPGGFDSYMHTSDLDEGQGSFPLLAEAMDLTAFEEVGGEPANGFHWGTLVKPPEGTFSRDALRAGDADQDLDFDQFDIIRVQQGAKYLTGLEATWGEGDWNGAPGGSPGNPPPGDGVFSQLDIIKALAEGIYLMGPYNAVQSRGTAEDPQTSIIYDANTGELAVDAPTGVELTSISVDSASGIFTGDSALNVEGSFDIDTDSSIFKATFGGSFGSISFGEIAEPGLDEGFLLGDLTVIGSLAGGGGLGDVDLIYVPVPEPSCIMLLGLGLVLVLGRRLAAAR